MSHLSRNPQEAQFQLKRGQWKTPCDDDDDLYELIEAAQQQREHEQPVYRDDEGVEK